MPVYVVSTRVLVSSFDSITVYCITRLSLLLLSSVTMALKGIKTRGYSR